MAADDEEVVTSTSLPEGTLILDGRFRIEGLLGGGGMGLVYRAQQVSLGRSVAVKVLRDDLPLAQLGERFRREAQLLSQVEHPAVVRVIDFGPLGASMCLVMELVEGETLEAVLSREAPLSVERAERILVQLAEGLAAIHARGIVHRDLKPDNVLLTRDSSGQEQARLLDFGIARLVEPEAGSAVTQGGVVLGTPEYLSPEQALGQAADARSDLYALGLILWRALIGRHPFPGPGAREFFAQHINDLPLPVVTAAPHLASFPALVATVMSCLAKNPLERPQSATQLLEHLKRVPLVLTMEAPVAVAPVPKRSSARWVAASVVGLVVLALAGWALSLRADPLRRARRLVETGRGSEALQVIDDAGELAKSWPMQTLQAAAMHQVGRHDDEWKVLSQVPATEVPEPAALEGLADDFGHMETPKLRKLLASFGKPALPMLQQLAKSEPQRWAQWGALRFIDFEYAGQGLALVELYGRALSSRDCAIRRFAAKRLAEMRNPEALPALQALKQLPRVRNEECGQDAAAAALVKLEKELPPE